MKFIALFLAIVVALMPPALAAGGGGATTAAMFAQQFPLTRAVLAADFPRDLQALEQGFANIDGTEISPLIKMQRAFLQLTAMRKKYARHLQFARGDKSALLVLSLADFYQSVLRRDGGLVCGAFAVDGAGTLYTVGTASAYALELDRQGEAYFSAVVSALEDPDVVGLATDDDWKDVMNRIVLDGQPVSYVTSIDTPKASDPNLCPALSAFMHAMVEVRADVGQRVRANFIQNATGY